MKKGLKILLDIIMTTIMLLLMNTANTGITIHELLGVGIFCLFVLHQILNWNWVSSISKELFSFPKVKRIKTKTRILYILDATILICATTATITGIAISRSVFTFLSAFNNNLDLWTSIHFSSSYVSLILISIHLGFHWKGLMVTFKKMFVMKEENKARMVIVRLFAAAFVLIGIKFSISKQIGATIVTPFLPSKYTSSESTILAAAAATTVETPTYATTQTTPSDAVTLEEFLGKMVCTLCHKRCSLLSPQCSKGRQKAQAATAQYEASVQSADSSGTSGTTASSSRASINASSQTVSGQTSGTSTDSSSGETRTAQNSEAEASVLKLDELENSPFSFIPVMSVYIAGTHYLLFLADKKKKKNT